MRCFFEHLGGCEGRLVKAHLVPKSRLKIEFRDHYHASARDAIWDPRVWRYMCGGVTGLGGHHGAFDAKQIRLAAWPEDLLEYLREHDIEWMADAYARGTLRA